MYTYENNIPYKPCIVILVELDDILFITVQAYSPLSLPVTVRVWMYKASTALLSTVEDGSVKMLESLVQVTLVAGPPVETQVRVNNGTSSLRLKLRVNVTFFIFTNPEKVWT